MLNAQWPPNYSLRQSSRAKYVRFNVSLKKGLEVIIPSGFDQSQLANVLNEYRDWISNKLLDIQSQPAIEKYPSHLELNALSQLWQINYQQKNFKSLLLSADENFNLLIRGDISNETNCQQLLIRWLKRVAKKHLNQAIQQISQQLNLEFANLSIRGQTTCWGSCSSQKRINLNYKLLFLPAELVNHVIIHELCHTKHMDHSQQFWDLVAKFDNNYRQNRRDLRKAHVFVPNWL